VILNSGFSATGGADHLVEIPEAFSRKYSTFVLVSKIKQQLVARPLKLTHAVIIKDYQVYIIGKSGLARRVRFAI
jgi:hypothetical protein